MPERILFNYAYLKVDMYVPEVKLCRQCGHTEKYCKGEKRCLRCGIRRTCSCYTIKCILFNSDKHTAVQKNDCPRWQGEREIKKIVNSKKISRREVLEVYTTIRSIGRL